MPYAHRLVQPFDDPVKGGLPPELAEKMSYDLKLGTRVDSCRVAGAFLSPRGERETMLGWCFSQAVFMFYSGITLL